MSGFVFTSYIAWNKSLLHMGYDQLWCCGRQQKHSIHKKGADLLNFVALRFHIFAIMTFLQFISMIVFRLAPCSPLGVIDQWSLVKGNFIFGRSLNAGVMKKVFDGMKYGQYIELGFSKTTFGLLSAAHATVIFKEMSDDQMLFCWFDPNLGIYKSESLSELCALISSSYLEVYNNVGVVDLQQMVANRPLLQEAISEANKVTVSPSIS